MDVLLRALALFFEALWAGIKAVAFVVGGLAAGCLALLSCGLD